MSSNKINNTLTQKFDTRREKYWYDYWLKNKIFSSNPNPGKPKYSMIMPPPNITGILHMGHILNNTIQDVLVRKQRMEGKETTWVPGIDHASIATEAKVVQMLKEKGIEKSKITRKEFLKYSMEWKNKYGNIILNQLKQLGASCDWDRVKFTMDPKQSKLVTKAFIELYEKGLIYKGARMINWDPLGKTALSDDEVNYKETKGILYYIKYNLAMSKENIVVATTRPETIMADVAICINPKDERYQNLIGKFAIIPLIKKRIPIISDEYVDIDYGTGCLKITPAHDFNDAKIGHKHKLEFIDILTDDGKINNNSQIFVGLDRFEARKQIVEQLKFKGLIVKKESINHKIGYSERTNVVVEPKISNQWFLNVKEISQPALEAVLKNEIKFYPSKFKNIYKHWMENLQDWCISRQLWWGHQIPAYYTSEGEIVVAETYQEAIEKAEKLNINIKKGLVQDEDVLDTWFSSWLWPISAFYDSDNESIDTKYISQDYQNSVLNYYFPTNDLVTAPEIIFFWVARMIIAGYFFKNKKPFSNVYFTGIVKDQKGKKMSKSLGNSPDPIDLFKKYGVDGVRSAMLFCSPAGGDLIFDEKLCKQGRNFTNKLWNSLKLIKVWSNNLSSEKPNKKEIAIIKWFDSFLNQKIEEIELKFNKFKISEIIIELYKLVFNEFCPIYLEVIKPKNKMSIQTYDQTKQFLKKIIQLLHPFMPFVTEEIWHYLNSKTDFTSICLSKWPKSHKYSIELIKDFEIAKVLISKIRNLRNSKNISNGQSMVIGVKKNHKRFSKFYSIVEYLTNTQITQKYFSKKIKPIKILINAYEFDVYIPFLEQSSKEDTDYQKKLLYYKEFMIKIEDKLSNKNFMKNAPAKVIEIEQKKHQDTKEKIKILENKLSKNEN